MAIDIHRTSASSPGQSARRETLLRLYDDIDDAAKHKLLEFAKDLVNQRSEELTGLRVGYSENEPSGRAMPKKVPADNRR